MQSFSKSLIVSTQILHQQYDVYPPLAAGAHTFFTIGNFEILGTFVQDCLIPDLLNDT